MEEGGQRNAPETLPPGRYLVPIVQEAGWAPGLVCMSADVAPTGIWSPDLPVHSDSVTGYAIPDFLTLWRDVTANGMPQFKIDANVHALCEY
jgi:hypothetical protein